MKKQHIDRADNTSIIMIGGNAATFMPLTAMKIFENKTNKKENHHRWITLAERNMTCVCVCLFLLNRSTIERCTNVSVHGTVQCQTIRICFWSVMIQMKCTYIASIDSTHTLLFSIGNLFLFHSSNKCIASQNFPSEKWLANHHSIKKPNN